MDRRRLVSECDCAGTCNGLSHGVVRTTPEFSSSLSQRVPTRRCRERVCWEKTRVMTTISSGNKGDGYTPFSTNVLPKSISLIACVATGRVRPQKIETGVHGNLARTLGSFVTHTRLFFSHLPDQIRSSSLAQLVHYPALRLDVLDKRRGGRKQEGTAAEDDTRGDIAKDDEVRAINMHRYALREGDRVRETCGEQRRKKTISRAAEKPIRTGRSGMIPNIPEPSPRGIVYNGRRSHRK